MARELDPFLGQFPEVRQAHHLIAAAVGQDRAVPVHEPVQPAEPGNALGTGAEHEVIGVAENDVGAGRPHSDVFSVGKSVVTEKSVKNLGSAS